VLASALFARLMMTAACVRLACGFICTLCRRVQASVVIHISLRWTYSIDPPNIESLMRGKSAMGTSRGLRGCKNTARALALPLLVIRPEFQTIFSAVVTRRVMS
jgi:hypothetical protein